MAYASIFILWLAVFALVEYLVRSRLGLPFSWREIHRVAFATAGARAHSQQQFRQAQADFFYSEQQARAYAQQQAQENAIASAIMRCYQILQLPQNATKKDISKNYRNLAKVYHPDVNRSPDAAERFKEINRAYEMLKKLGRG